MKKNALIIFGLFLIISCTDKRKALNGHWHQFTIDKKHFTRCYIFTDSSFVSDKETVGGKEFFEIPKKDNTYKKSIIYAISRTEYLWRLDSTSKICKKKDKIIINDSIIWRRQENNTKNFISDFSTGLQVNINPFLTQETKFETNNLDSISFKPIIYIGKIKNSISNDYQIQLNDKIAQIEDLRNYLFCRHCEGMFSDYKILIYADKNTPKEFLEKVENEITNEFPFEKNQIYYLTINPEKRLSGFNRRK